MPDEKIRLVHASGECEIDLARRELRVLGSPVPVGGRAFEIIEVLGRSAGELVTKNELIDRIWPGSIVSENTLHVHAGAIRKALGPNRGLLKTESGRGYRLLGDWTVRRQETAKPPVGVHQMRVDGESPVTNFPATVTRLVGRTAAVARLRDLLSAYRVVTLTGPGGIGKTSLALKAARGIVGEFADGAWLVELASLTDPALLPPTAAHVLRLGLGVEQSSAALVARGIGARKLLLFLDNCEHVIGAAAEFADILVRVCPNVTVLTTSRETLRIEGEHVFRVSPLEVPAPGRDDADHILGQSAVELFIARTKALDIGFLPHPGELASIGAICRHLDGIPLAIEFAAAHASTFGVQPLAARLHDRFALLTGGRRTALPRHRTMRGVLDWSYDLLSVTERRLLRHLAIFSGGFTIEAAAAVVSDDTAGRSSVMEGLASLVAKSMITLDRASPSRWYLLETIRAYALEKLVREGERDEAARLHAMYFRDLFRRSAPPTGTRVSEADHASRLPERDNVRSALDWCFSTDGDSALGAELSAGAELWFFVDLGITELDPSGGERQSSDHFTRDFDAAVSRNDVDGQARALVGLWNHHAFQGEHDKALAAAERLSAVASRIGDPAARLSADQVMGHVLVMLGRGREARGYLERFLNAEHATVGREERYRFPLDERGPTRAMLSRALWLLGLIDQARREAEAALDELSADENPLVVCRVLQLGLCRILHTSGDFMAAEHAIARLTETATAMNSPFWQTAAHFISGKLMIERGEFTRGVAVLNDAFDASRQNGWRTSFPEFKGALASGFAWPTRRGTRRRERRIGWRGTG